MSNTLTIPATIAAYKKHGVRKSYLHYITLNHFTLRPDYRDLFKAYFLRKWTPSFFFGQVVKGSIWYEDEEYIVVYHRKSRGQLMQDCTRLQDPQLNVTLSFRKPVSEFQLPGYVLVN